MAYIDLKKISIYFTHLSSDYSLTLLIESEAHKFFLNSRARQKIDGTCFSKNCYLMIFVFRIDVATLFKFIWTNALFLCLSVSIGMRSLRSWHSRKEPPARICGGRYGNLVAITASIPRDEVQRGEPDDQPGPSEFFFVVIRGNCRFESSRKTLKTTVCFKSGRKRWDANIYRRHKHYIAS